jgi:hypothetical protein
MEDESARDELLRSVPEETAKAIADIIRIKKKIKQERKNH